MTDRIAIRPLIFAKQLLLPAILLSSFFGAWNPLALAADPPQLFFDTEIVSLSLSGGPFSMPLGIGLSPVDVLVGGTKSQDHNSSRSNKTNTISPGDPDNPDDVDPNDLDGVEFVIESRFDVFVDFSLQSNDLSPNFPGGGTLVLESDTVAQLLRIPPSPFTFDKNTPDFGMLSSSDNQNRALEHRGHVTVLKIAMGGDGDGDGEDEEFTILADGFELSTVPGTDKYLTLPNGTVQHTFDTTMFLRGSIDDSDTSLPFVIGPLFGSVVEVGRLSNAIVPEPTTLLLLAMSGVLGAARRRSGIR